MDLVESPQFEAPLVILQTVLDEVRHRSLPLHNRLKALLCADDKRAFVFYNEYLQCVIITISCFLFSPFLRDTAVTHIGEESPNDMNDRGLHSPSKLYLESDRFHNSHTTGRLLVF